jgi:hypothetical protein
VVMAGLGAGLMLVNAVRAFSDPAAFATYLGLPLATADDAGLVQVYGLRALFIGLLIGTLLILRERTALSVVALTAVVMPVGDAILTSGAGAPGATVGRHVGIALFLLVAGFLLRRDARQLAAAQP